ncbi:MAG: peptide chain release factor N(5)-glutamine methyltransferase [Lachnospiraceae bacterium]|nr:peptide chain release factor N(5)-glutamine methyltransferase [Lachnospiraceae bacterium]
MNYSELFDYAKNYLIDNDIADYNSDSYLLLEYVFGISKTDFFLKKNENVDDIKLEEFKNYLKERASGKPLQYITGTQDFMGLTFKVNENVLIPRYDTEILVDTALKVLKTYDKSSIRVCDMCTGSGCIGISIAKLGNISDVTCVDISKAALEVAKENANINDANNIHFVNSDLFEAFDEGENAVKFDFIISNPPYIRSDEIEGLMREVRLHEPRLALDGDDDGLKFYNIITKEAAKRLYDGGWLLYEIGCDQGISVSELMKESGFTEVKVIKDLAGLDRVVIGKKIGVE